MAPAAADPQDKEKAKNRFHSEKGRFCGVIFAALL